MTKEGQFEILMSKRIETVIRNEIEESFKVLSSSIANKVIEDLKSFYLYQDKKLNREDKVENNNRDMISIYMKLREKPYAAKVYLDKDTTLKNSEVVDMFLGSCKKTFLKKCNLWNE